MSYSPLLFPIVFISNHIFFPLAFRNHSQELDRAQRNFEHASNFLQDAARDYLFTVRRQVQQLLIDFEQVAVNDPIRGDPNFTAQRQQVRDLALRFRVTVSTVITINDVVPFADVALDELLPLAPVKEEIKVGLFPPPY